MANGKDTFSVIKDILAKDILDDTDAHRLLLAGISDLKELIEEKEEERKEYNEEREKEQKVVNDKVDQMFTVYKFNTWLLAALGASVIGLIVSLITGQATIVISG